MSQKFVERLSYPLLLTLGAIGIIGPFASDLYLPAFPQIAAALHTTAAGVQFTITCFTIGLAVGQLLLGSLSDRIGRKPILVLGIALMGLSSLYAAYARALWMLMVALVCMGLASAAVQVSSRALVSDLAHGPDAARAFSVMGMLLGFGPILGPIVGAMLMSLSDWRGIFYGFAIMCAVFTTWASIGIRESLIHENRHSGGFRQMLSNMGGIIRTKSFMWHAAIIWVGVGTLFAYISASPFVLQTIYGLTPLQYTLVFGVNGAGLLVTGVLSGAVVHKFPPQRQARLGMGLIALAAAILGIGYVTGNLNFWLVEAAFFLTPMSMGFLFGPVTALSMREVRHANGTALAIQGSFQFVVAGITAVAVGLAGAAEIAPLVAVYAIMAFAGVFATWRAGKVTIQ